MLCVDVAVVVVVVVVAGAAVSTSGETTEKIVLWAWLDTVCIAVQRTAGEQLSNTIW